MEQTLQDTLEGANETVQQQPPSTRPEKSLQEKLYDIYAEECGKEPEAEGLQSNVNLLEKLMKREPLPCLVVSLYPENQGYSLMLKDKDGVLIEPYPGPYVGQKLLKYLDAEELPSFLIDILEKSPVNVFHSGCVITEIRDYRQCRDIYPPAEPAAEAAVSSPACQVRRILLRPTMQSLVSDVESMTSDSSQWTQEEKLELESQLTSATAEPLCLDPSVAVACTANKLLFNEQKMNTNPIQQCFKRHACPSLDQEEVPSGCSCPPDLTTTTPCKKQSKISPDNPSDLQIDGTETCNQSPCELTVPSKMDLESLIKELLSLPFDETEPTVSAIPEVKYDCMFDCEDDIQLWDMNADIMECLNTLFNEEIEPLPEGSSANPMSLPPVALGDYSDDFVTGINTEPRKTVPMCQEAIQSQASCPSKMPQGSSSSVCPPQPTPEKKWSCSSVCPQTTPEKKWSCSSVCPPSTPEKKWSCSSVCPPSTPRKKRPSSSVWPPCTPEKKWSCSSVCPPSTPRKKRPSSSVWPPCTPEKKWSCSSVCPPSTPRKKRPSSSVCPQPTPEKKWSCSSVCPQPTPEKKWSCSSVCPPSTPEKKWSCSSVCPPSTPEKKWSCSSVCPPSTPRKKRPSSSVWPPQPAPGKKWPSSSIWPPSTPEKKRPSSSVCPPSTPRKKRPSSSVWPQPTPEKKWSCSSVCPQPTPEKKWSCSSVCPPSTPEKKWSCSSVCPPSTPEKKWPSSSVCPPSTPRKKRPSSSVWPPQPSPGKKRPSSSVWPQPTPGKKRPSSSVWPPQPAPGKKQPSSSVCPQPTPEKKQPSSSVCPQSTPEKKQPSSSVCPQSTPEKKQPSSSVGPPSTPRKKRPSSSVWPPQPAPGKKRPSSSVWPPQPAPGKKWPSSSVWPQSAPEKKQPSSSVCPQPTPEKKQPSSSVCPQSTPEKKQPSSSVCPQSTPEKKQPSSSVGPPSTPRKKRPSSSVCPPQPSPGKKRPSSSVWPPQPAPGKKRPSSSVWPPQPAPGKKRPSSSFWPPQPAPGKKRPSSSFWPPQPTPGKKWPSSSVWPPQPAPGKKWPSSSVWPPQPTPGKKPMASLVSLSVLKKSKTPLLVLLVPISRQGPSSLRSVTPEARQAPPPAPRAVRVVRQTTVRITRVNTVPPARQPSVRSSKFKPKIQPPTRTTRVSVIHWVQSTMVGNSTQVPVRPTNAPAAEGTSHNSHIPTREPSTAQGTGRPPVRLIINSTANPLSVRIPSGSLILHPDSQNSSQRPLQFPQQVYILIPNQQQPPSAPVPQQPQPGPAASSQGSNPQQVSLPAQQTSGLNSEGPRVVQQTQTSVVSQVSFTPQSHRQNVRPQGFRISVVQRGQRQGQTQNARVRIIPRMVTVSRADIQSSARGNAASEPSDRGTEGQPNPPRS